ncbi:NAD-dependent epimerase/dehydratase family protein [Bradyrhizobium sp. Pear76]|uniref:NAD-dependent epimerase/dehydratase family protein n=1 Tax=Bradyrhizobium oropedii TaxID=1571201 RepID=UPI0030841F28|nr:NAD-dependent epimerase/dehydratase family protein [Bradyrhizobium oropedii]
MAGNPVRIDGGHGNVARPLARAFVTGGSGFVGGHLIRALVARGIQVVALARSASARNAVVKAGAMAQSGDLSDVDDLAGGMAGCDTVFHAGAYLPDWDRKQAFAVNVVGSRNVVAAARLVGVSRIVYVSGIGVMIGSGPVRNVDENVPRGRPVGVLGASRVQSEREMQQANADDLGIVVVRFPYVWGPGNTLIPSLRAGIARGRFRWIAGGRHEISTVHIDNAVEGLILAARRGRPGEIYYFTDGAPVELREFFEVQLRAAGIAPPRAEISFNAARLLGHLLALLWKVTGRTYAPPLTPTIVRFLGQEVTVNDQKARRELGYAPRISWPNGPF